MCHGPLYARLAAALDGAHQYLGAPVTSARLAAEQVLDRVRSTSGSDTVRVLLDNAHDQMNQELASIQRAFAEGVVNSPTVCTRVEVRPSPEHLEVLEWLSRCEHALTPDDEEFHVLVDAVSALMNVMHTQAQEEADIKVSHWVREFTQTLGAPPDAGHDA